MLRIETFFLGQSLDWPSWLPQAAQFRSLIDGRASADIGDKVDGVPSSQDGDSAFNAEFSDALLQALLTRRVDSPATASPGLLKTADQGRIQRMAGYFKKNIQLIVNIIQYIFILSDNNRHLLSLYFARNIFSSMMRHAKFLMSLDDVGFVNAMYKSLLGRAADPPGAHYHLTMLRGGQDRARLVVDMATSVEARRIAQDRLAVGTGPRRWSGLSLVLMWRHLRLEHLRQGNYKKMAYDAEQIKEYLMDRFVQVIYILQFINIANFQYRKTYLARSYSKKVYYFCFSYNAIFIANILPANSFSALLLGDINVLTCRPSAITYRVTLQMWRDSATEGEMILRFWSDERTLYVLSFTIVPGAVVGSMDQHAILISRMQGKRGTADEIRQATKELKEISPQYILFYVLCGIARASGIDSISGVSSDNNVCRDNKNLDILEKSYDQFFDSLLASGPHDGFYMLRLPVPQLPLSLVAPGHRLRTKLKRKIKSRISEFAKSYWQGVINGEAGNPHFSLD